MSITEQVSKQTLTIEIEAYAARFGGAEVLVPVEGDVRVNGEPVPFPHYPKRAFLAIAQGGGQVVTEEMLLKQLYPKGRPASTKTLDVMIFRIRKKLMLVHEDAPKILKSIYGRGYTFGAPPRDAVPPPDHLRKSGKTWHADDKARLVVAVLDEDITLPELLSYYPDLSVQEFTEWRELYQKHGVRGLRLRAA